MEDCLANQRFVFFIICPLAPFVTVFVFGLRYEFHWPNFRLIFYRLPIRSFAVSVKFRFRTYIIYIYDIISNGNISLIYFLIEFTFVYLAHASVIVASMLVTNVGDEMCW